mmetsp:Transcript_45802/g.121500  ORF Transcript_45802/g.121500 Transcript_45802/m.121500 type:complete len:201 (+) Transcript_45802:1631-2233(+)
MALMTSHAFDSGILRPTSSSSEALPVAANHCATLTPKPLRPPVTRTFWYVLGPGCRGSGRTAATSLRAYAPSARSSNSAGNAGNNKGAPAWRESRRRRSSGCSRVTLRRSPMMDAYRRLEFSTKKSSKSVARACVSARSRATTSPTNFSCESSSTVGPSAQVPTNRRNLEDARAAEMARSGDEATTVLQVQDRERLTALN